METSDTDDEKKPKRAVIQGAALFPYHERAPGAFRGTRLWGALQKIGVGAIPLLPGSEEYLSEWVKSVLRGGGWSLADRVIAHRVEEHAWGWKVAASEVVLIGVLRGDSEAEFLLETEPEWRLYEELTSNGIDFDITAGTAMLEKPEDPRGRAWFRTAETSVQFRGAEGFVLRGSASADRRCSQVQQVIDLCR